MDNKGYVLALYDFRSKQEYIYRTNKIREISGASMLLTDIYKDFASEAGILYDLNINTPFEIDSFEARSAGYVGEVVYDGGGNLMVLYKNKDAYINSNHKLSELVRKKLFTANVIASYVKYNGNFAKDRTDLYNANALKKNTGNVTIPYSVFPFTQVDRETLMPITNKDTQNKESHTTESELKQSKFEEIYKKEKANNSQKSELYLDDITTEKGRESLLAIIYIDGNAMGERLKKATSDENGNELTGYDESIKALREFSKDTNRDFVDNTISAIEKFLQNWQSEHPEKKHMGKYRRVIAGGDEITIICNARLAKDIVLRYFDTLDSENSGNYACAGIALFHSHAPFADIYEIAEQCCEIGKKASSSVEGSTVNYIDFHFCRSAVTNDAETIREQQEKDYTQRPYELSNFKKFCEFAEKISDIGRSNIKELANSRIRGASYYKFDVERVCAHYKPSDKTLSKDEENNKRREIYELLHCDNADKLIFDIAQVYDLWFAKDTEFTNSEKKEDTVE